MANLEIQNSIIQSINQLSLQQQMKLLDFIESILVKKEVTGSENLLQFAGFFEKKDLNEMESALEDCSQIDEDEW
jgi:hypothetical protein